MTILQQPKYAFFQGAVRPYQEAVISVSSEAAFRGLNVFEGLKGYWQQSQQQFALRPATHTDNLLPRP